MVGSVYCSRRHSTSLRSYLSLSKKRHAISNFLVPIAEVLSYLQHLQAHCDKLKAFRIAQFFQNSKIQKITVKKIFFRNSGDGFLLIGVFRVYIRSFKAKLAETKIWIFSESNPTIRIEDLLVRT